jgi:predicted RND superfamily exporter protein
MLKFGRAIAKNRILILIIALLLLIPSALGMAKTRINYDMLTYLPDNLDTVKGQNILMDDFGKGAFSLLVVEGMEDKDVSALKSKIEAVAHVDSVIWYDSYFDDSMPMRMLPDDVYDKFNSDDCTMMAVFFNTSTSADATLEAVSQIRTLAGERCYVSGLTSLVSDLKSICEKEEPIYVTIAVLCACAAMVLFLDSWLIPFIFLASIGMAIMYNLGTNYFLGEISYITKAIAAVLQLAVTMDYSIFLWHSYSETKQLYPGDNNEAMANAIADTLMAVAGSALTTIAGFIALCFMSYTMGADLGIVMAKGVLLGVIGSITTLPSLILIFDKSLEKTRHKSLVPNIRGLAGFVTKHYRVFLILFVIIIIPAFYGYKHTELYYDFTHILTSEDEASLNSEDLQFLTANANRGQI